MNQPQNLKPQFGLFKAINGCRSLRQFSMKKYKHLSKLKIAKRPIKIHPTQKVPISTKLSTSIKSLKYLDLSQCNLTNYNLSQVELIGKKFHRIIRFSQCEERGWKNSVLLTTIMLKKAKNLKHLSLEAGIDHFPEHAIRLSRLKIFNLTPIDSDPAFLLDFSKYCPLALEELSLTWKEQVLTQSKENISLGCFKNLQKLALGTVLPASFFKRMIETIAEPFKLKSLQFQISRNYEENYESGIKVFLNCCHNLEELSIKADMNIYPDNNSSMKLKKLSLEPTIEDTEEVLSLRNFIQSQKETLESLDLKLRIWGVEPKNGILEALKQLKGLKKLNLELYSNIPGISLQSSLAGLIEGFGCLEELDGLDVPGLFDESGFEDFCRALSKRNMRSFNVCLKDFEMNEKNSSVLFQTLRIFSRLESITLKDFRIEGPDFYNGLSEIVCYGSKNLNEVILENVKRENKKICCESVIKMLRCIIQKPTMKSFCYLEAPGYAFASDFKEILSLQDDVLKEVHHFDYLQIPFYVCKPTFYHWNLNMEKWKV